MKLRPLLLTAALAVVPSGGAVAQVDPCVSSAFIGGPPAPGVCYMSCPAGDGTTPADFGWFLSITVMDSDTLPIAGIPATDIWLEDCGAFTPIFVPCGPGASMADGPTDAAGMTTMSANPFAVGGCGYHGPLPVMDAVRVLIQGTWLSGSGPGCTPANVACQWIRVRSADLNGNGTVGLGDVSLFSSALLGITSNPCADLNCNGTVTFGDFAFFSQHVGLAHSCP